MLIQIRILLLLLIKGIGICDHWSIGPSGLYFLHSRPPFFVPSALHGSVLSLLSFWLWLNANPVPDFRCYADLIWIQLAKTMRIRNPGI
jgi:hypothetical protein